MKAITAHWGTEGQTSSLCNLKIQTPHLSDHISILPLSRVRHHTVRCPKEAHLLQNSWHNIWFMVKLWLIKPIMFVNIITTVCKMNNADCLVAQLMTDLTFTESWHSRVMTCHLSASASLCSSRLRLMPKLFNRCPPKWLKKKEHVYAN